MRNKLCKEKEQQVSDADFTSVSVGIFLVSEQMTTEWLCWRNTVRTTTDAKDSSHCTLGFAEHGQCGVLVTGSNVLGSFLAI